MKKKTAKKAKNAVSSWNCICNYYNLCGLDTRLWYYTFNKTKGKQMKTIQLTNFKNKNGKLLWAVNLKPDGKFLFINFNRSAWTASKEELLKGYWEGSIPKKVREFAIQYK